MHPFNNVTVFFVLFLVEYCQYVIALLIYLFNIVLRHVFWTAVHRVGIHFPARFKISARPSPVNQLCCNKYTVSEKMRWQGRRLIACC